MTLTLSDKQSSFSVDLFGAQQVSNEREGAVDASPAVGSDSEETYLTSLEQSGQATIQGGATALQISRDGAYSSDPRTALAEWVADFDAILRGAPGDGLELSRDYRGDTFEGYVDTLQWTVRGGETLDVAFSVSFIRGQGLSVYERPSPVDVTVTDEWSVNDRPLDFVAEFSSQKTMGVNVSRRTFAESPDDNDLTTDSGVRREITATGTVVGTDSERNQFDADLADTLGNDTLISVEEGLTGQTFTGMVSAYSATDEAGRYRDNDFSVTIVEGSE